MSKASNYYYEQLNKEQQKGYLCTAGTDKQSAEQGVQPPD